MLRKNYYCLFGASGLNEDQTSISSGILPLVRFQEYSGMKEAEVFERSASLWSRVLESAGLETSMASAFGV